jgi:hypothetical protein
MVDRSWGRGVTGAVDCGIVASATDNVEAAFCRIYLETVRDL